MKLEGALSGPKRAKMKQPALYLQVSSQKQCKSEIVLNTGVWAYFAGTFKWFEITQNTPNYSKFPKISDYLDKWKTYE